MSTETQRHVLELQSTLQDLNRQLVQVTTQIQIKQRDIKVTEIQLRELTNAGSQTTIYSSVGKMFLHASHATIKDQLQLKTLSLQDDITVLGKKQAYLEKTVQETQLSLKESVDALIPVNPVS